MLTAGSAAAATTRVSPSPSSRRPVARAPPRPSRVARLRASDDRAPPPSTERSEASREVLDAFFVGKALAETILERAGGALADALGELSRFDSNTREEMRAFQDEVMGKAREDMRKSGSARDDGMR